MAYVGRSPRYGFLEGQTATFNGSTTVVTLQRNVSSTDAIDVYIDNVHQEPDVAYTLSSGGNSITFTGTPDNGAVLYIRFHGLAFDTARAYRLVNSDEGSSLTLSLDGTTALTATSSGITIPNLTVTGTTTSVNSTNLNIGDNTILLNSDVANDAAPTESAGITINRGSSADVDFIWNETTDEWYAADDLATGGIFRVKGTGSDPTYGSHNLGIFRNSGTGDAAKISIIGNSGTYSRINFGDENDDDVGQLNYSHTADTFALNKGLGVTGNITVSGTVDGVDIATLNTNALLKTGGTMTGDLNLGSGVVLEVNGTTAIDSSRNGSFADLEFTGSLTHAWTNSGVVSIGVAQRGGNIFNTGQNLLQVMGADAYIGGQAMAGGDLLLRGGFAVDNVGLSIYPGDVTIRGGVPHSGTDGNGGKIYLQTGGTSANRLTIRGDGNIGVGMGGSSSAKFTIQGKAGTSGNPVTDKALHVIEGGYNNGNTFQVSDSSSASRFHVDGNGVVMVNAVQSTNGDFQVQTVDKTHGLFVNAANNQIYLGGATQSTARGFLNLGGIKFNNGASTGGEFLSWDNEGATGNQSLIGYWYDGSSYRNRFRVAGDHGETVVNGSGDNVDFRVASDGNQNMLVVDAGLNRVGIGAANPSAALDVKSTETGAYAAIIDHNSSANPNGLKINYSNKGDTNTYAFVIANTSRDILDVRGTGTMFHNAYDGGAVVFNNGGNDVDFTVKGSTRTLIAADGGNAQNVSIGTGINTNQTSLNVNGGITISTANDDVRLAAGMTIESPLANVAGGAIQTVYGVKNTMRSATDIILEYRATSWKSYGWEVHVSNTFGYCIVRAGGYSNGSCPTGTQIDLINGANPLSAASQVNQNNQYVRLKLDSAGSGVHTTFRVHYHQSGGDGVPKANRLFFTADY